MRVLWLNTWCLPHITGAAHIRKIASYVAAEARRSGADVVALGEVFGEAAKREMTAHVRRRWRRAQCVEPPRGGVVTQDSGLLVLLPEETRCHGVHFEAFEGYHLWDGLASKGFLGVDVETRRRERLLVVATHLQNAEVGFSLSRGERVALGQLHQLLHRSWIWAKRHRVVVVGDFNLEPRVVEGGLSDPEREAFEVLRPSRGTTRDTLQIFDYAVVSRAATPPAWVKALSVKEAENPSDHLAVLVGDDDEGRPSSWRRRELPRRGGEAAGQGYQRPPRWPCGCSSMRCTGSRGWGGAGLI